MSQISLTIPEPQDIWSLGIVWIFFCVLAISLRFYARKRSNSRFLLDDWLAVPAAAFTIGMCIAILYGIDAGALVYPPPPPPQDQDVTRWRASEIMVEKQLDYSTIILQTIGLTFTKLSCLMFYRRIVSKDQNHVSYIATNVVIAIVAVWGVAFVIANILWCGNSPASWWHNIYYSSPQCGHARQIKTAYSNTDFVTNLFILSLPIPSLIKLDMSKSRKVATLFIFALGSAAVIVSIIRFVLYVEGETVVEKYTCGKKDPCWGKLRIGTAAVISNLYWNTIESGLALVAVCLPTICTLFAGFSRNQGVKESGPSCSGSEREEKAIETQQTASNADLARA